MLNNITQNEFEDRKLVQWKKWNTMSAMMSTHGFKFWKEIFYGHYIFYRDYYKQYYLNRLTLKELQNFYDVRNDSDVFKISHKLI